MNRIEEILEMCENGDWDAAAVKYSELDLSPSDFEARVEELDKSDLLKLAIVGYLFKEL